MPTSRRLAAKSKAQAACKSVANREAVVGWPPVAENGDQAESTGGCCRAGRPLEQQQEAQPIGEEAEGGGRSGEP